MYDIPDAPYIREAMGAGNNTMWGTLTIEDDPYWEEEDEDEQYI